MTISQFDFYQARQNMVDNQLRPAWVNTIRIVSTMRVLPREECVNESQRELAYADINLPLRDGRVLSEPRVIARMVQIADIQPSDKVMIIGAGTGYSAALLAHLTEKSVYAVEENEILSKQGEAFCKKYAPNVVWKHGKLCDGFTEIAPFDVIIIDGGITTLPASLIKQLAPNGRLVSVLHKEGQVSQAVLIEHSSNGFRSKPYFYAALPILSELNPNYNDFSFSDMVSL